MQPRPRERGARCSKGSASASWGRAAVAALRRERGVWGGGEIGALGSRNPGVNRRLGVGVGIAVSERC